MFVVAALFAMKLWLKAVDSLACFMVTVRLVQDGNWCVAILEHFAFLGAFLRWF